MKRDLNKLANTRFDLLIIGGGIHGAVLFYYATLFNLTVALIEKGDFAQATSSNSQKIIHGGLRYLQNLDFLRMLQSIKARKQLMLVAPHLIHPLKCLMPLYGNSMRGKEIMRIGLRINDLIGFNRNCLLDQSKHIPNGEILPVQDANRLIPHLEQHHLSGAAQWHDAICVNTERLVLGYVRTACKAGGVSANYVMATKIIHKGNCVVGVEAQDQIAGNIFDIRAIRVANCTGPWVDELLCSSHLRRKHPQKFVSGINVIVKKLFPFDTAVGVQSKIGKGRLYFVVPWRDKSIVGTEYFPYHGHPDNYRISEKECLQLINGFNQAYPAANLKLEDVNFVHNGLLPLGNGCSLKTRNEISASRNFKILNHGVNGINGLISVIGVKYTTASYVSAKALKQLFPKLSINSTKFNQHLLGGNIDDFLLFKNKILEKWKGKIDQTKLVGLLENYGTEVEKVLHIGEFKNDFNSKPKDSLSRELKGQILFAAREEMALKLSDVIFRRTDIGTSKRLDKNLLNQISKFFAKEMGWAKTRRQTEIQETNNCYPIFINP